MNYVSIFLVSFFVAFSGALAPGPLLAAVIYESTKQGAKAGPLMMFGHMLLEAVMVTGIIFGFVQFIQSPFLIKSISLAGAVILIYLGIDMLKTISKFSFDFKQKNSASTNLAFKGITMSIANPYWTVWWLTIGLGLVLNARKIGFYAIVVFFLGHIMADFIWYTFVSVLIERNKRFISKRTYKLITCLCAFVLIGFGIYFAITTVIVTTSPQQDTVFYPFLKPA